MTNFSIPDYWVRLNTDGREILEGLVTGHEEYIVDTEVTLDLLKIMDDQRKLIDALKKEYDNYI